MSKPAKITVMCNVHENGVWRGKVNKLQHIIASAYHAHIDPSATFRFVWLEIPTGQGWLAGEPSTASTLLVPTPDELAQAPREKLMKAICDDWQAITGCSVNEIIVNAIIDSEAQRYLAVSQTRFAPEKMTSLKAKLAARMLSNRLRKGYFTTTLNMP